MKHASNILNDLDKMSPAIADEIRKVAGSDTTSTPIRGANRDAGAIDMNKKVGPHYDVTRPPAKAPPTTGSTKPAHSWPAPTRGTLGSGLARKSAIGSMPSRTGPSR